MRIDLNQSKKHIWRRERYRRRRQMGLCSNCSRFAFHGVYCAVCYERQRLYEDRRTVIKRLRGQMPKCRGVLNPLWKGGRAACIRRNMLKQPDIFRALAKARHCRWADKNPFKRVLSVLSTRTRLRYLKGITMLKFDHLISVITRIEQQEAGVYRDFAMQIRQAREFAFDKAVACIDLRIHHLDQMQQHIQPQTIDQWMDDRFISLTIINANRKYLFKNIEKGMKRAEYVKFGDTWQPKNEPKAKKEVRFMATADANKARTPSEEVERLRVVNRELARTERAATLELENLRRVVEQGGYKTSKDLVAENKRLKAENKKLLAENTKLHKALDKAERQFTSLAAGLSIGRRKAQ